MKSPRFRRWFCVVLTLFGALILRAGELTPVQAKKASSIRCNNLIYAKDQTSVCFADKFLSTAAEKTGLNVTPKFFPVRLDSSEFFDSPFTVISGTGKFRFSEKEREHLRRYLMCGGFLLVSPGCSDSEWNTAFRNELKALIPEAPLTKLPMTHPIFSTIFKIPVLTKHSGGRTLVEGMELNGRLVMVYSEEGLNDHRHTQGCCCCGGDMIEECEQVNVNVLIYSLLH
jgi:hypothetical protein